MAILIESSVRIALLAAAVAAVMKLLRIASPRAAHGVWVGVAVAMLLMPAAVALGPLAQLPLLPAAHQTGAPTEASRDMTSGAPVTAAAATTAPAAAAFVDVRRLVWMVYVSGATLLLVRLAIGAICARRLIRGARQIRGRWTHEQCVSPVTVGLAVPVVILPHGWWNWPAAELEAVLAHENEHLRRRDPLIALIVLVNRAVFWFHPLAWWLSRRIPRLAEEACDAVVVSRGHDAGAYRRSLVRFARATAAARVQLAALGTRMPGSALATRLRLLERGPAPAPSRSTLMAVAAGYVVALTICAGTSVVPIAPAVALAQSPSTQADRPQIDAHESEHFEIHFARALEPVLPNVERDAEAAYARVSAALKHDLAEQVPLLVVGTNREAIAGEQAGDVIDRAALRRPRIVLSVEAWKGRPDVLVHELTHRFLLDIAPGVMHSDPWLSEGLAEHLRGTWTEADARRARAAVASGRLDALDGLAATDGYWGHALFDFIGSQYGEDGIRRFLFALRSGSRPAEAARSAFGTTTDAFVRSFQAYVITRFGPA